MKIINRFCVIGMGFLLIFAVSQAFRKPLHGEEKCTRGLPPGFFDIRTGIPDAVIEIKYATADNFTGSVLDGYEAPCAWGLEEMVSALVRVRNEFRKLGYRIVIYDAYRPLRAERQMIRWAEKNGKEHLLGVYIPAAVNPTALHGHASGNAVDLGLATMSGYPVDMGTRFDEFTPASRTENAAGVAGKNRLLLRRIMEENGFRNYAGEWWHYQYLGKGRRALDVPVR